MVEQLKDWRTEKFEAALRSSDWDWILGCGHALHPDSLQLATVLNRDQRDRRARRLCAGRPGQSCCNEDKKVQVSNERILL